MGEGEEESERECRRLGKGEIGKQSLCKCSVR